MINGAFRDIRYFRKLTDDGILGESQHCSCWRKHSREHNAHSVPMFQKQLSICPRRYQNLPRLTSDKSAWWSPVPYFLSSSGDQRGWRFELRDNLVPRIVIMLLQDDHEDETVLVCSRLWFQSCICEYRFACFWVDAQRTGGRRQSDWVSSQMMENAAHCCCNQATTSELKTYGKSDCHHAAKLQQNPQKC